VTNSSELYEEKFMNEVCGRGRWMQFCPPVCREWTGRMVQVKATTHRIAYERKQSEACSNCTCNTQFPSVLVPSASPEMNLAESAQAELLRRLTEQLRSSSDSTRWKGSVKKKMLMLETIITELNDDTMYWQKLYGGLRRRWQRIIGTNGALLDK